MPYVTEDGRDVTIKGYICPVGQVCKVRLWLLRTFSPNDETSSNIGGQ